MASRAWRAETEVKVVAVLDAKFWSILAGAGSSAYRGGSLTTPPIRFSGNRLLLNHNCNATGTIYVELRDSNDVAIPGYRLGECEEVTGNDTGWEIRWRDHGADVSALAGQPVKMHVRMRNAKLYAFEFSSTQSTQRAASQ